MLREAGGRDANGKRVFPSRNGLNFFNFAAEKDWRRVTTFVDVMKLDAVSMSIDFCASYWEKFRGCRLEIRDIVVARVSDTCSATKAICRGRIGEPFGLGGGVRATLSFDAKTLRLVIDGADVQDVAFAIDPRNTGEDMSVFAASTAGKHVGKVVKLRHYVTPEVRRDNPISGEMPGARFAASAKGMTIELPMAVAYPLLGDEKSVGFAVTVRRKDGSRLFFAQDLLRDAMRPADLGHLER